jgi:glycosyltransferase involved in cell wall biosynthesis
MLGLAAPIWRELGCDLHILSIANNCGVYAKELERAGWKIHLANPSKAMTARIADLTSIVRKISPDVVHIHNESNNLLNCLAIRICGIPVARTVHNNFQFNGLLRLRKKFERMICRLFGVHHVAISKSVQENELVRFSNPSQLCWNWFNAGSFRAPSPDERVDARQRLGLPLERKIVVSVGNGSDVKNYACIIDALSEPDLRSLLYCQVGLQHPDGVDQALVVKHGLGDSVRFCGPSDTVRDWLWACDLYVMPSIFEGLSLAAAEAIASGCNCVFASSPGLVDYDSFGAEVFWTEPKAKSLAEAIRRGIDNPIDDIVLQQNSELIRQSFSVESRSLAYYDLWVSALKAPIPSS